MPQPPIIDRFNLRGPLAEMVRKGKTIPEMLEELNKLLPAGQTISESSVKRYLNSDKIKKVKAEVVKADKRRVKKVVVNEFRTIEKALDLFTRLDNISKGLEAEIAERKKANPKASIANAPGLDKLLTTYGHLRNMIETLVSIQDKIYQHEMMSKFFGIVLETVRDLAPQAYEEICRKISLDWQMSQVIQGRTITNTEVQEDTK